METTLTVPPENVPSPDGQDIIGSWFITWPHITATYTFKSAPNGAQGLMKVTSGGASGFGYPIGYNRWIVPGMWGDQRNNHRFDVISMIGNTMIHVQHMNGPKGTTGIGKKANTQQ